MHTMPSIFRDSRGESLEILSAMLRLGGEFKAAEACLAVVCFDTRHSRVH
jgi:hypothetical protein